MDKCQKLSHLAWIDIVKGIGIILVVLGHAFRDEMRTANIVYDYIYNIIYSFHMPLFFAISGVTFGLSYSKYKNSLTTFYKKKAKSLFIPLVSYSAIIYVIFVLLYKIPFFAKMLSDANYQLYSIPKYLQMQFLFINPYASHLWFIWVLFCMTLIVFTLAVVFKFSSKFKYLSVVVSIVLFSISFFDIPSAVKLLFTNMIFFVSGILVSEYDNALKPKPLLQIPIYIVSWSFLLIYTAKIITIPATIGKVLLTIASFPVIHSIFMLSKAIKSSRILEHLGNKSFTIYLLHQPFCCGFVGVLLYNKMHLPAIFVILLCSILSFIIPLFILWLSRKIKFIGKTTKFLFNIS